MDVGESLVGAYLRQIKECHTIAFNQFLPGKQGEIDVIGLAGQGTQQRVWLVEVAVHLDNLNYGGYAQTVTKIAAKVATAREYASNTYQGFEPSIQFWSPRVPSGLAEMLEELDVELVVNEDFTSRVNELAALASTRTKQSGDDAFRFLQLLTHLRGNGPTFGGP
jgi:Holliday junction resolvase-like predicted endonuclease